MHAPPPPAWLLRLLLAAATFSPSRRHHQTLRWRALSPYATAASPGQSRAACVTVQAPFVASLRDMAITPLQLAYSGKDPVLRAVYLGMGIALGKE